MQSEVRSALDAEREIEIETMRTSGIKMKSISAALSIENFFAAGIGLAVGLPAGRYGRRSRVEPCSGRCC
jgi:ABC-type antimicrobial peptide transport system permease subunit